MPENFQNVPAEKIRCKEGASSIAATWRGKHFSLINFTLPPPFWDVVDDDDDANVDIGDDDDDDIDDADIDIDGDDARKFLWSTSLCSHSEKMKEAVSHFLKHYTLGEHIIITNGSQKVTYTY